MRLQTGLNSKATDNFLNINLAFLLVPAKLETIAKQLNTSFAIPGKGNDEENQFRGTFTPIVEPILDASSETAYYSLSRWQEQEHVEVAFLEGHRQPFIEEQQNMNADGRIYKVRMPAVAKAIDHRGIYKNDGA